MEKHTDLATVNEEKELLPGGDIRQKGNKWMRKAWSKCMGTIARVPREALFRKVVRHLVHRHHLCPLTIGTKIPAFVHAHASFII